MEFYKSLPLLPGANTQQMIQRDYIILMARVMCTYLPAFKCLAKLIPWHIEHEFTKEHSKVSEVVSLCYGNRNTHCGGGMFEYRKLC